MWPVEVVEVLPLLQLVVEELGVVDDDAVEHPIELFVVDTVGSFHFAVESGCGGFDVDVSDTPVQYVIVKLGLEFGSVVGLDRLDLERQLGEEVVEELDRGLLIAAGIDAKDPESGAVVDSRELIEAFPSSTNRGDELDVHLDSVAWLLLLVALPSFLVALVPLGDR